MPDNTASGTAYVVNLAALSARTMLTDDDIEILIDKGYTVT